MKILLNILTHGDETIGLSVVRKIKKLRINPKYLTFQLANKKAYTLKRRYLDQDLNRAFPGKKNGNSEQRLAASLLPKIKEADIVLDIHSTKSELKDAIIVTKLDEKTKNIIKIINPKYVLIMRATKKRTLISHAKIGIAFEYGKNNDQKIINAIVRDIVKLCYYFNLSTIKNPPVSKKQNRTRAFLVSSEVKKTRDDILLPNIRNYKIVRKGQAYAIREGEKISPKEDFYPILFGQNNYETIFGFAGKPISF